MTSTEAKQSLGSPQAELM